MFEEYDSIMKVEEVCEAISVGRNYVYRELGQRNLVGFRIGREWRISKEALIKYVEKKSRIKGR